MRKHRMALHVTFYEDSKTLQYYVEHDGAEGTWELWSEGTLTLLNELSGAFAEFKHLAALTMAEASPSTSRTSDVG